MVFSWWWLWVLFLIVFILSPVSYGWGYRRWGPPYPRYLQRRRGDRAAQAGNDSEFDHHAWGWGGDLLWILFFIWIFWFIWIIWMGAAMWQR